MFKTFFDVLNVHNKILDIVVTSRECVVDREMEPFVPEYDHHPTLDITVNMHIPEKICFLNNTPSYNL